MRDRLPLISAVILLAALTAAVVIQFLSSTGAGHVVYSLDDPYIHMAMARNLVEHGVYGVTCDAFSSSSSSPQWVLLLSGGYALLGVSEILPLLLALLAAAVSLWVIDRICRDAGLGRLGRGAVLLAVVVVTPLVPMVMTGMESALQIAIDLMFVRAAVVYLGRENRRPGFALWGLAPLVTAVRYEGVFLIAVVGGLMLWRRRPREMMALVGLGLLPIVGYGLWAHAHGSSFLPNSIVAKSGLPSDLRSGLVYLRRGLETLRYHPEVLLLAVSALGLSVHRSRRHGLFNQGQLWLLIFAATAVLHVQFAQIGALFRYEAYLMALGLVAIGVNLGEAWGEFRRWRLAVDARGGPAHRDGALTWVVGAMLIFCLLAPFAPRVTAVLVTTPRSMRNIFEQQYQMGLFLRQNYPGRTVVANDIGAICFLAGVDVVDVVGLADDAVLRHRREPAGENSWLGTYAAARGAAIAVVYQDWLESEYGTVPNSWHPMAHWTIAGNIACARAGVDFLGLGAANADSLGRRLRDFAPRLPAGVMVRQAVDSVSGTGKALDQAR